jgi:molecular chaperone GrpE
MAALETDQEPHLLAPADFEGEIERLHEDIRAERDRHLRTLADFKNYRRRVESDKNKLGEEGKRAIIVGLLDIVDDTEKTLHWARKQNTDAVALTQLIHQRLLALLEKQGVVPFESVGLPFNHDLHEALAMDTHGESEPGTIVDELRRGYLWKNELLRAAQVRVAGSYDA